MIADRFRPVNSFFASFRAQCHRERVGLPAVLRLIRGFVFQLRLQKLQMARNLWDLRSSAAGDAVQAHALLRDRYTFQLISFTQRLRRNRQTTPRMDRHETIVTGRCETFRYCHIGGKGMTSAELKHRVKLQEWAARIQDCRSSGLSVRAWCRQEEINAATYYRWERELLALAETEPCSSVPAVRFAELPAPKRVSRNVAERSATLHIGNASLDIYPGCDTEQLKMLVELLRLC